MGVTDLIRRAEDGEPNELWRELLPLLQATAGKKLRERGIPASVADGDDLAQTAIRRFSTSYELRRIEGGAMLWALLEKIMSCRIIDLQRRQALPGNTRSDMPSIPREVHLDERLHDSGESQSAHEQRVSLDDWVSRVLRELPSEDHRNVFLLLVEDPAISNVEIGRRVGKGEAAIRRHRAVIRTVIERAIRLDAGNAN